MTAVPIPEIRIRDRVVVAVPSVHHSFPFAVEVHRLCADTALRPDAIAVELTPSHAAAIWMWMRDLGVGPDQGTVLPCMLGVVDFQQPGTPGCATFDGREGTADTTADLICLTPTDSIVEAIRCGVEVGIPVYGIDIPQPEGRRRPGLVQDPLGQGVGAYVETNRAYATQRRAHVVDGPRERAMARHLTYLLTRHRRVLLVCGLAHWESLQTQLTTADDDESVSSCGALPPPTGIVRAIVHPALALGLMDRFPQLVYDYQNARRHPNGTSDPEGSHTTDLTAIDVAAIQAQIIESADVAYFLESADKQSAHGDWNARDDFADMLMRLGAIAQRRFPSALDLLETAAGTMSLAYRRRLAEEILRYPWASPRDPRLASLPVLAPTGANSSSEVVLVDKQGRRGEALWLSGPNSDLWHDVIPWEWHDARRERMPPSDMVVNWPPIDRLVTALSLRAITQAREQAERHPYDVFTGDLGDGFAMKPTIHAQARGRDEVYVRSRPPRRLRRKTGEDEWEPVVWLFRLLPGRGAHWRALGETFAELIPHARQPDDMQRVQRERGTVLIEQIGFCTYHSGWPRRATARGDHPMFEWSGIALYTPTHFTLRPTARFTEQRQYRGNPIVSYADPTSFSAQRLDQTHPVVTLFQNEFGMTLNLGDWAPTLIRMAIPFAASAVTVVVPDLFVVPRFVHEEAARRGVKIRILPHSVFPHDTLATMSQWYGVCPIAGSNGETFPAALESLFGEPVSTNSNLLPPYWLNYGRV